MPLNPVDVSIILALVTLVILIGAKGYRGSGSIKGYFLAGKGLGSWVLAFSIMATYFSAASFLAGGTTYLYNLGFGAWLTAWHIVGVVLMWVFVGERLFRYASKTNIISVPDFIEHRYQSRAAKMVAATVIMLLFTLYLTSVYKGGAIILATILNTSFAVGLLLLTLPVLIYVCVGGLKAAAVNNLLLGVLMLVASLLTFGYIMAAVGGPLQGLETLQQMTVMDSIPGSLWLNFNGMGPTPARNVGMIPALIMSITFSISVAQVALPTLLMQFYAAKDLKVITRGRIIGTVAVALYAFVVFSLGAYCHIVLDPQLSISEVGTLMKDTDWVIPKTIMALVPSGLAGLILAAPVAASMSTLAVTLLVLSGALVRDVIQSVRPGLSEKRLLLYARASPIIFAAVSLVLTLLQTGIIVEIVGAAFGTIFVCFLGPVTLGLYWKGATKAGAIVSMISGLVVGLAWYLFLYKVTWIYPVIPALAVSLPLFFIVSRFTKKPPDEVLRVLDAG
ncbi:MAG: sodium/solute symporter [Candidatus Verstraetearchaeota archaeon]|nr:sodium/solute symporter [Candidatus Verstraetearchaeota archaeon]